MKRSLDAETMRRLLDYEPDTGIFYWRIQPSRSVKAGAVAGSVNDEGYRYITVDRKAFAAHRLAWLYTHGVWPEHQIDHINGYKADNRIANLRDVSGTVNMQNQTRSQKNSTSGYRGVMWDKRDRRWRAKIKVNGQSQHIGYFKSAEEARAAYLAAKLRLHPGDVRNLAGLSSLPIPTTLFGRTA